MYSSESQQHVDMDYEEWCRLGGVTPQYARAFHGEMEYLTRTKQKLTQSLIDRWLQQALEE